MCEILPNPLYTLVNVAIQFYGGCCFFKKKLILAAYLGSSVDDRDMWLLLNSLGRLIISTPMIHAMGEDHSTIFLFSNISVSDNIPTCPLGS